MLVAADQQQGGDLRLSYASVGANSIVNVLKTYEISMFSEGSKWAGKAACIKKY